LLTVQVLLTLTTFLWNTGTTHSMTHCHISQDLRGGQMFNKYNAQPVCSYYTCGVVVDDVAASSLSTAVFLCQYMSPNAAHSFVIT
jgi:hypothetical protein